MESNILLALSILLMILTWINISLYTNDQWRYNKHFQILIASVILVTIFFISKAIWLA